MMNIARLYITGRAFSRGRAANRSMPLDTKNRLFSFGGCEARACGSLLSRNDRKAQWIYRERRWERRSNDYTYMFYTIFMTWIRIPIVYRIIVKGKRMNERKGLCRKRFAFHWVVSKRCSFVPATLSSSPSLSPSLIPLPSFSLWSTKHGFKFNWGGFREKKRARMYH